MTFKNSVRLLLANFSLVWKLLAYCIIALGIGLAFIAPVWNTLMNTFSSSGALSIFEDFFTNVNFGGDIPVLFLNIYNFILTMFEAIKSLFAENAFVVIYLAIVIIVIIPIVFSLCELATSEILSGYMSSLAKYGFGGLFIKSVGRSMVLQIVKYIMLLPFNLAISVVMFFALKLTTFGGVVFYASPYIISIIACFLLSIKRSAICCYVPSVATLGSGRPFKAIAENTRLARKRFWRIFSTYLGMYAILLALTILFGAGMFIIVIPFGIMFSSIISMVNYYECKGNRYYVDMQTIITPKRLEEADKFDKLKNLI